MRLKKLLVILYVALGIFLPIKAQLEPVSSMYSMNGFLFNPAIAGSDGFTTVSLAARDHMVGFENSPKTYVLSIQGRLLRRNYKIKKNLLSSEKTLSKRSGRVGLGATLFNDRNGLINRTGGSFSYAYHIYMQNTQLSFGLSLSAFQFKIAQNDLHFRDQTAEPLMNQDLSNQMFVPDVSGGAYVLTPNAFLGFSITNLFQTRIPLGAQNYDYHMYRTYFFMGGKRFNEEDVYSFEPSFLLKGMEKMIFQADLQMRCYYHHDYYLGVCYRTGSSIGVLIGAKWSRMYFGYAFDYGLNSIQRYSYGAHEINVALKLGDNARRYRWLIRY
jgi:type IX secretion system PorP/SprF family membrane protein